MSKFIDIDESASDYSTARGISEDTQSDTRSKAGFVSAPHYSTAKEIIEGLEIIPQDWALTPVRGNKRPYRDDWQIENPLSREAIAAEVRRGSAKGYGLRTGEISGGTLAIDPDGHAAEALLQKLADGDLPDTVIFSSGRPGRRQLLYFVPEEYRGAVKTVKLKTGVKDDDGKEQQLEFRWDGLQSVLPPSVHPITGSYHWVRSPQDVEIAICPMWVIEMMLNEQKPAPAPAPTPAPQPKPATTNISSNLRPPLEIFLGNDDRALVESGAGNGSRNDAAKKLSLNLVATARRLSELGIDYDGDPRTLYDQFCARCTPPLGSDVKGEDEGWWKKADAKSKGASLDDEKLKGCNEHWLRKQQPLLSINSNSVQNGIVTGDNGVLSPDVGDNKTTDKYSFEAIVTTVTTILGTPLSSMDKSSKIDKLYLEISNKQKIDRKVFDRIVANETLKQQELAGSEKVRLEELLGASRASINWDEVLPAPLARDMYRDANVRNIDPVVLWQSLLPSVSSLMGVRVKLDVESHTIPALTWTATVLETGGGKSRGDDLIYYTLRKMQAAEDARFQEAQKQFKLDYRDWEKGGREGDEPAEPTMRKYIFDIATIQAVVKRLSETGGNGAVWARDELDGLFKSLGQFAKGGSDEGLQILLKLWNGGTISSDRVSIKDSFFIEDSALSLSGGIQPGVFRRLFQDPEDCNGLQARFLFAVPQRLPQKRIKGYCYLSGILPKMFDWLAALPQTTVKLSPQADDLYSQIIDLAEIEYAKATNPSERAWLAKWATHIMRIALILHAIENFYANRPGIATPLDVETLKRALAIGQYYRASFQFLQEKVSTSDELSTILLQIIDRARQTPAGITLRDTYRSMRRSIDPLAKESGVDTAVYTEQLFEQAAAEGYGEIVRSGRSVKLVATTSERIYKGVKSGDNVDNNLQNPLDKGVYCHQAVVTIGNVTGDNALAYLESGTTECLEELIKDIPEFVNLEAVSYAHEPEPAPDPVMDEEELSSPEPEPTPAPAQVVVEPEPEPLAKGDRIRVDFPGSKRNEAVGVVTRIAIRSGVPHAVMQFSSLDGQLRNWEFPAAAKELVRI